MKIGKAEDIAPAPVQEEDITGVRMKILMSDKDGAPNFVMRVFEVEPGGHTAFHTHTWEHEVYVLGGKGVVKEGQKDHHVEKGSFVLVAPGEEHQFINPGTDVFKFICVVPISKSNA